MPFLTKDVCAQNSLIMAGLYIQVEAGSERVSSRFVPSHVRIRTKAIDRFLLRECAHPYSSPQIRACEADL